jgi:hypothetical protein
VYRTQYPLTLLFAKSRLPTARTNEVLNLSKKGIKRAQYSNMTQIPSPFKTGLSQPQVITNSHFHFLITMESATSPVWLQCEFQNNKLKRPLVSDRERNSLDFHHDGMLKLVSECDKCNHALRYYDGK